MIKFCLPIIALGIVWAFIFTFSSPGDFPRKSLVTVSEGASIGEVAALFARERLVRSPKALEYLVRFKKDIVVAGDYFFSQPANVFIVAARLASGDYDLTPIKVTIPEGATSHNIAVLLARLIPDFDRESFTALAAEREGYLFPDTYYVQPTWQPERLIELMTKQFRANIKLLDPLIASSGRTLEQVVIMASILEREARTTESRRLIAGILWKRLDDGMPLQVDAVFPYIMDRNTFEVSRADLATSSPYNTYRYRGLPIGPIANPGLDALTAALTPVESDYWFFLSDRSGAFHYAVDFEGHKRNKALYLP
ncbi:MAG: endolytic transglycosylase MltG [Patescibacteria group bacterium]